MDLIPNTALYCWEEELDTLYTDDTGRFPIRSHSGNQYVMLAYHAGANAILVEPFQSKADHHRIPAYNKIMARLKARNIEVKQQVLDNEASAAYKFAITDTHKCALQLVPPNMHRRNKAERAIRTFKAHFLSILAGVDPAFPPNRWDLLLPQAELTVNLLRQSTLYPTMSAWEHLNGFYNFDATPMGPPGCRIISHVRGSTRRSWDFRGGAGFYVGPSLEHYRCYRVIKNSTQQVAVNDTVVFQHPTMSCPTLTPEDRIIHCLRALTKAIQADVTWDSCHEQLLAIESLRAIFTPREMTPTDILAVCGALPVGPPPRVDMPLQYVVETSPPVPAPPTRVAPVGPRFGASTSNQPIAQRTRRCISNANALAVSFALHPDHIDKCSKAYRAGVLSPDTSYTTPQWSTVPTHRQLPVIATALPAPSLATFNPFVLLQDDDDDDVDTPDSPSTATLDDDVEDATDKPTTAVAFSVLDHETGKFLEHRQLRRDPKHKAIWDTSYANEIGRLCQGVGTHPAKPNTQRVAGTNTMRPIRFEDIPKDRIADVAHTKVVCEVRPTKDDPNRTRITIGGNTITYLGDCGTKTGSLESVKLVINSTLSTPDARFMSMDLSNFYLMTPLDRPEYARIQLSVIPQEIIDEYNLEAYAHKGWVYYELSKGMYGLKQSGKLANDLLSDRLCEQGYFECATTPGLWRHKWRPIIFVLIVDDFGVQYTGREHAEHLHSTLQKHYEVTTDWEGKKFAGIDLQWDYAARTCRATMDGYINEVLIKFDHQRPKKPQQSPHKHRKIIYGAEAQLQNIEIDTSPPLDATGIKRVQAIVGCLLYYARACDNKLLCTLSTISTQQASATQNTLVAVNNLLDYVATYPSDGITFKASNMILAAHSDASYLSESKSRSRAGAHIFLSNNDPIPQNNGPVLSISAVLRSVYGSVAEAELAALYKCATEMVPLRNALEEMGWKQPRSPIQVDNSTAEGYVNNTIVTKRLKSIDMRINWLKDRESQGQFRIYWDKGSHNLADYHTKHHPPEYHIAHRQTHAG
jgi:hypothetical protein